MPCLSTGRGQGQQTASWAVDEERCAAVCLVAADLTHLQRCQPQALAFWEPSAPAYLQGGPAMAKQVTTASALVLGAAAIGCFLTRRRQMVVQLQRLLPLRGAKRYRPIHAVMGA